MLLLKRKNSCLDQDLNQSLHLYMLVLHQLCRPDVLLGQARIFSLISFPLYLQTGIVPFVDGGEHLPGIAFIAGVFMLIHIQAN